MAEETNTAAPEITEENVPPPAAENGSNGHTKEEVKEEASIEDAPKDDVPKKEKPRVTLNPDGEKRVIRQVEYYFGDANLAKDKFMKEAMAAEKDGWLTLELLLKFNRLKAMCDDPITILEALAKSTSGLLELDHAGQRVRRDPFKPLPTFDKEHSAAINKRTLYLKGFPADTTLDDLQEWFDSHGGADRVGMRRATDKSFKGSLFVTMSTQEGSEKLLEAFKTEEGVLFKETKLDSVCSREDYWRRKTEERKQGQEAENQGKDDRKAARDAEIRKKQEESIPKGTILKVTGANVETPVNELKEFFRTWGDVKFIDIEEKEMRVRFAGEENSAVNALAKANAALTEGEKLKVKDVEVEVVVLEGDEELKHWQNIFTRGNMSGRNNRGDNRGGRGGGRGKGQRGKGRGGGRGGGPAAKRQRTE